MKRIHVVNLPQRKLLQELLAETAARHDHLCPRQVLGVRLALRGLRALDMLPLSGGRFRNGNKRLLTIVETDGCGADGVAVASDCHVGHRTLRVSDFGKVAATFVDTQTGMAVRVAPSPQARRLSSVYAPQATSQWHAYLEAYQCIPDEELLVAVRVRLTDSVAEIVSRPDARAYCAECGEEIINEREVRENGHVLCRFCAGNQYYQAI